MKHIDLFSGIGGFALAASWVWGEKHHVLTFCEKEEFPRRVLKKHWPDVPCNEDIFTLKGNEYGAVDLVTGGFPCQPFSQAGKQKGKEDDRYLWPETLRIIQEAQPRWFIGENVAGIINLALDDVLASLESAGYSTETVIIPACAVNAPHRRDRVWVLAYSEQGRFSRKMSYDRKKTGNRTKSFATRNILQAGCPQWKREIESGIRGVSHGVSDRLDRLATLGNAIVPQVAAVIMSAMKEVDRVL